MGLLRGASRRALVGALPFILVCAAAGCVVATGSPPGGGAVTPPGGGAVTPPGGGAVTPPPDATKLADGAACASADQCTSGVCEGQGCGGSATGVCRPAQRMCTTDLREYCGCDGQVFRASGSCPGRRFASRGGCLTAPAALQQDGAGCTSPTQCASGVCEGQGCGDDAPGVCAAKTRSCTRDRRTYCGCDGKTFQASGSCPGARFAARAACPGG